MQNPFLVNALAAPRINQVSFSTANPNAARVASEEEIARQKELAKAFAAQAAGNQDIRSPWQGVNQVAQAAFGGLIENRAKSAEQARRDALTNALTDTVTTLADGQELPWSAEQMRTMIALDPSFGESLLNSLWEQKNKPKPETWVDATRNGIPGQESTTSGKFDPYPERAGNKPATPYSDLAQIQVDLQNGYLTPEQAQAEAQRLSSAQTGERKTATDQNGVLRWVDTGKPVFEGVVKDPAPPPQKPWWVRDDGTVDPAYIAGQEAGRTTIQNNVGPDGQKFAQPPFGQDYKRNPDGTVFIDQNTGMPEIVTIPKGPQDIEATEAATEAEAAERQEQVGIETQVGKAETMLDAVRGIKDEFSGANTPVTGTLSIPFAVYSGSPAGRVRAYVGTLQSGVALQTILKLKEASATGATGFGALNQKELQLLLDDIGALNPDSTEPDIFMATVDRIERRWTNVVEDIRKNVSPERAAELGLDVLLAGPGATQGAPVNVTSEDEYNKLPSGTTFIAPDGSVRKKP